MFSTFNGANKYHSLILYGIQSMDKLLLRYRIKSIFKSCNAIIV